MTVYWIVTGMIALLFLLIGIGIGTPAKKPEKLPYTCSCGHSWGAHDETGCGDEGKRPRANDKPGFEYVGCACRRYAGDEPPQAFGLNRQFLMPDE